MLYSVNIVATPLSLSDNMLAKRIEKTSDLLEMSLEELLDVEIVVASKTEETIFDAPSSVTVFTRQQLLRMGVNSVEELLNFVPGFIATREIVFGQGYMVSARGSTTPQSSYNVLFMLDGQRLNNDLRGGALDTYGHFISLANVKQIEIIRGPGSASYGTGAMTGVVNIVTATDINDAFVSVGNLDSREAYFNTSRKGKNWSLSLSARHFEDQGDTYHKLSTPDQPTAQDSRSGQDVQLRLNYDKLRLNLRHNMRRLDGFYMSNFLSPNNRADGEQNFITFDYKLLDTAHWDITIEGGYSKIDTDSVAETVSQQTILALPPSVVTTGRVAATERTYSKESAWNLGINGRYRLNENHTFFAGLGWYQPTIDKFRRVSNYNVSQLNAILSQKKPAGQLTYYENPPELQLTPESSRDLIGLYLQHKYQVSEQVALTWGARYDHYPDVGSTVNPRAALVYSPTDKTKFKWLYGEAFRAPAIFQADAVDTGNPQLKPEKIKTMELAWLQQHQNFQTTLTYFYSRASNKIDTVLIPGTTNRRFENLAGDIDTAGWEMEASTEIGKGLSLRAAYTLMQKTEENPRRFPKQTFSLIANYHYDKWDFNLNTFFHDSIQQQIAKGGLVDLSSYWVTNGTIRYALLNKVTLVGKVSNLFDEEYHSSSKIVAFMTGVPNRGRTYALGVEVRF